jgi:peptidoglycan/LPS O-acetylase OafA/YrhL
MDSKNDGTSALAGFWGASYFPALDGLRAICILLVIFNHTRCRYPPFIYGWVGVDIFFVLSGFLITTLLLRERESYGNLSLKGFYTRRAFRILPVYFVVLAGYLVLIPLLRDWKRWEEMKLALPYLLTFTQEFRPAVAGNIYNQTWSLAYEEKFYLLWPLVVLIGFPFRTRRIGILIAAASPILLLPPTVARSYGGLFLGALFGILLDKSSGRIMQSTIVKVRASPALVAVVATYLLAGDMPSFVLVFSLATSFFTAALVTHQGIVRRFLEHPVMVLFGKRSYAMYLVHIVLLDGIEVTAQKIHLDIWYVVVPMAYLVSFAAAMALFYLVERPCVAQGRKLSRRMRERISRPAQMAVLQADRADNGVAVIEREEAGVPRAF